MIAQVKIEIFLQDTHKMTFQFLNFVLECFHESVKREVIMNIKGNAENGVDELAKKCYEMMKNMYSGNIQNF